MADKPAPVQWLDECEEQDYPAAQSFLGLLTKFEDAEKIVNELKTATISKFKAKDILRASGLKPLEDTNAHVVKDYKKITKGEKISPLLLARDTLNGKVIVADGYHRLCAVHAYNEDEWIFCKIV